jgi:hypothetical protein
MSDLRNPTPSRPHMPGYGLEAVDTAAYPWSAAEVRLAEARNYWLCSTCPNGRPHAMPVWGLWIAEGFYFSTGRDSRKGRNLAGDPRMSMHLESGDEVVILEGEVREETDPGVLATYVEQYERKYTIRPDVSNAADVVYALRPRRAFTWQERDFTVSAVRWRFEPD